ncbi:MAG: Tm-1-like ATP-binding domain-containing protein [Alphaproteobacteria bacterium]
MASLYLVGTADTKAEELAYIEQELVSAGHSVVLVDVGTREPACRVTVPGIDVAAYHPEGAPAVRGTEDRGTAVAAMGKAFAAFLGSRDDIAGIIGIGGGGGTSIITAGMRTLPIGIPKLMVSTLASGDVAPYVDVSDIVMMNAVTDLAGLNGISRTLLKQAAFALAGMVDAGTAPSADKPGIGLTMFGVTTPCVTQVVERLRTDFDCQVFHATGTGGRTMEKLVDSGLLTGVVDVTTTEVCDHLLGGVLSAGADRLGAIARSGVPYVGSVGAVDMVNFGAFETVPARFAERNLYRHNPQVTLMRTTAPECAQIGRWIAEKLNRCNGPVRLLIPEKGVSALDAPGQPYHDPHANAALFEALEDTLSVTDNRRIQRLPFHINDAEFAGALADEFRALIA